MQQATKRFASMIIALLFVVGSFAIFFELVRPAYQDAQTVRADVISREDFVTQQEDAISQVQQLIATYQSEASVQDAVNEALPNNADFGGALFQLNGIAANNALAIQSFAVSAPAIAAAKPPVNASSTAGAANLVLPTGTVTFQVKFNGRYEDIKTFLADLEQNIRLFDVQNVSVQPAGGAKPGQDLFTVDMSVAAYYQVKS